MCSAAMPEYSTGMSQPPNGTIFAPEARWRALSGVFFRGAAVAVPLGILRVNGTVTVLCASRAVKDPDAEWRRR